MSMRYPGGLIATSPVNAAYPSGVWTQAQAIPYQSQNVWTRDQYWPYTTLLLQGNGTNGAQNNTFLDSSTNNFTITRNGNTTQGSFTPYEANGYWSNYFDGTDDFIYVADSSAFTLGSGDFTVEAWVWTGVTGAQKVISGQIDGSGTTASLSYQLEMSSSDFPRLIIASGGTLYIATSSTTLPKNQWVHVAGVRDGSTLRIYVNGVQYGTQSVTGVTVNDSSANVSVGRHGQYAGLDWNGYISNFRLVKGTCVYPSGTTFTPSTAPLTAITNTSLLTCQSNRFLDNSTNAFAITVNGNTSVQAFQPFPGQTTYSTSVLGGSGYFDGSGDYLTAPANAAYNFGTGDFTVEFWALTTSTARQIIIGNYSSSGATYGWAFQININSTGDAFWGWGNSTVTNPSGVWTANQWNHVAVCRSGTTTKMFVNGVQASSVTDNTNYNSGNDLTIGRNADLSQTAFSFTGYVSNARVVKGTAVYTSAFTPPTAPLTAITNTSLLTNFTNAGISDAAMMNDLETVGNAQISTSVVKYGTGSMAFDGSGDGLYRPNTDLLNFGSGNFTIEFWINFSSKTGFQTIASMGYSPLGSGGNWIIQTGNGDGKIIFYRNNGVSSTAIATDAGPTVNAGQWYHIAIVKNGTTTTIYRDGVNVGSGSDSNSYSSTGVFYVGGGSDTGFNNYYFNGYIDDLRITKGAARYITNFTPPPARMPGQ